jgi:hypothetical protein
MTITLQETNKTRINHEIRMLGQRLDKQLPTYGNVKFPATQVDSTDGNTLDDYEEGTFTPGIAFGGGSTGVTYSASLRTGIYTKVGDTVTCHIELTLTAKGSSTGVVTITGLPFTVRNGYYGSAAVGFFSGFSGLTGFLTGLAYSNTTTIRIYQSAAAATSQITDTVVTNTSAIYLSVSYKV